MVIINQQIHDKNLQPLIDRLDILIEVILHRKDEIISVNIVPPPGDGYYVGVIFYRKAS